MSAHCLVGRLLVGIPQPIADVAGGLAGVDRAASRVTAAAAFGATSTTAACGEGQAEGGRAHQHGSQLLAHSCHRWQILSRCYLGKITGVLSMGQMSHFRPEKPIELTIFFANAKNKMRMGSAATRTAAIRPAQSGLPCGRLGSEHAERDREHAHLVVGANQQRPEVVVPLGDEGEDEQA